MRWPNTFSISCASAASSPVPLGAKSTLKAPLRSLKKDLASDVRLTSVSCTGGAFVDARDPSPAPDLPVVSHAKGLSRPPNNAVHSMRLQSEVETLNASCSSVTCLMAAASPYQHEPTPPSFSTPLAVDSNSAPLSHQFPTRDTPAHNPVPASCGLVNTTGQERPLSAFLPSTFTGPCMP